MAAVICAVLAAGSAYYQAKDQALSSQTSRELAAVADSQAGLIQLWLGERRADAEVAANTPGIQKQLKALLANPTEAVAREEIRQWAAVLRQSSQYGEVGLYDADAKPLLVEPPDAEEPPPELAAQIRAALRSGEPALTNLHWEKGHNQISMEMLVPMGNGQGAPTACLVLGIRPEDFFHTILRSWPSRSATGQTVLVRRDGSVVASLFADRTGTNSALKHESSITAESLSLAAMAANGRRGAAEGLDARGVPVIANIRAVRGTSWLMIAKVDHDEIDAPLRSEAQLLAYSGAMSLLALWLGGNLVRRRHAAELREKQTAIETERRAKERQLAIVMGVSNDIALLMDRNMRVIAANKRAAEAYGHTAEELAQLPIESFWATGEDGESPRERAMLRSPEGGCFESVHRRKNGSEFPVEVSGRTIDFMGSGETIAFVRDITERKLAENRLRESEERFRLLFKLAPIPLRISGLNGEITEVNEIFTRLFGHTVEEVPTLARWRELAYPDEAYRREMEEGWEEKLRKASEEHPRLEPIEARVACKNGATRIVEISVVKLGSSFLTSFFDLTERKKAEAGMMTEQEFNRALLENLYAGVVACDAEGRLTHFNKIAREWHGIGIGSATSENWVRAYGLYDPDGATPLPTEAVPLYRASRGEAVQGVRFAIKSTAGTLRQMISNASPMLDKNGRQIGAVVVFHDLTKEQENEAQLRLQSQALNAAANAIVITDANGKIVWANTSFSRLTGYSTEEALGRNPSLLKSGEQDRQFYERLWDTIGKGEVWQGELRNRRKDGSIYDEEMTITPVLNSGGAATHYVAIKQDVTKRKQLEREFLRAQRMEGVGLLAGGIAHDLNNVLAPVLMAADLLRGSNLPPDLLRVVQIVETSAKRGSDIIKQILTFARGADGAKGPVQLRHLVKDFVRMAAETFPRNIKIHTEIPADLWPVNGDATQLHQVLLNLSVNARDAMPAGGELTFTAANTRLDAATAGEPPKLEPGDYVRLEVADTGTGMPRKVLDRIFEPFFTTKEQGKGTGLGLSTVMGIARGHGGRVRVESSVGQGSKFIILLPALPAGVGAEAAQPKTRPPRGMGELILIVDDEPSVLAIAETVLIRHGYRTLRAVDGLDAITLFLKHRAEVALLITDIMMPTLDGVALVTRLTGLKPGLKCIAASGLMDAPHAESVAKLKGCGVAHFLSKPFTGERLLDTVEEALKGGGQPEGSAPGQ